MMQEKQWFSQEYQSRFRFLVTDLGFSAPYFEDGGLYAELVYPRHQFAAVFSWETREISASCALHAWQGNSLSEPRVAVEYILEQLGVVPQGVLPNRVWKKQYSLGPYDSQIISFWGERIELWRILWKPRSRARLTDELLMRERLMQVEADYYEYIWRSYGVRIVDWAHEFFSSIEKKTF